jgi:hypothetical protein
LLNMARMKEARRTAILEAVQRTDLTASETLRLLKAVHEELQEVQTAALEIQDRKRQARHRQPG